MSKLLMENKQLSHIVAEVAVLLGMTMYFSNQNKKLTVRIEELAQRLEEHEDIIKTHDQILRRATTSQPRTRPQPSKRQTVPTIHKKPPLKPPVHEPRKQAVNFQPVNQEDYEIDARADDDGEDEHVENLDNELEDELRDLDETDLKDD